MSLTSNNLDSKINTCMICLKQSELLTDIGFVSSDEMCLKLKLEKIIPELEWKTDYRTCRECSERIENSYSFRELCLNSEESRCRLWNEINLESVEIKIENDDEEIEILQDETSGCELEEDHSQISEEFCCKHCNKQYKNKDLCDEHEKSCSVISKAELKIEIDSGIEYKPGESGQELHVEYKCDICGISFNGNYLLKRHKRNVHATEKNFKCDECNSTFVSSVYLSAHKKYHSSDRKHICLFCGKGFITASDLYHHEKIHKNKRAYKCPECGKAFNTSSHLRKHNLCVHSDKSLWKYSCGYCKRKFPLKTNLDSHVKTHTGEKNFSCHVCNKKLVTRSALTRHLGSHSAVKSFECNYCDLVYKHSRSLKIHLLKSHGLGDTKIEIETKLFYCHLCPKSYSAKNKLERHVRSHTGEKPFKCPNCDKTFIDKSYIKKHLKSAHDVNT